MNIFVNFLVTIHLNLALLPLENLSLPENWQISGPYIPISVGLWVEWSCFDLMAVERGLRSNFWDQFKIFRSDLKSHHEGKKILKCAVLTSIDPSRNNKNVTWIF